MQAPHVSQSNTVYSECIDKKDHLLAMLEDKISEGLELTLNRTADLASRAPGGSLQMRALNCDSRYTACPLQWSSPPLSASWATSKAETISGVCVCVCRVCRVSCVVCRVPCAVCVCVG